jgi:hypothetical protein
VKTKRRFNTLTYSDQKEYLDSKELEMIREREKERDNAQQIVLERIEIRSLK